MTRQFRVLASCEFKQGNELVANYLPQFVYRFTERNSAFVESLIAEGMAEELDDRAAAEQRLAAGQVNVTGSIKIG